MSSRKVSPKQMSRAFRKRCMVFVFILAICPFSTEFAFSQIVQLPSTGTFSLQTSVLAPDSGSAYLGGNQRSAAGNGSLGPGSQASGGTTTSASAMVRATIIDLNELDIMIRSQAGTKPAVADLVSNQSKPSQYASTVKRSPEKNAEYEYLAALTHTEKKDFSQMSSDTNYYLALASTAKQQRHWAAVELYYKLAWESLPEARRESISKALLDARSKPVVDSLKNPKSAAK